jgi:hypothetical protein
MNNQERGTSIVLEPSTNTHRLSMNEGIVESTEIGDGILDLQLSGGHGIISHGEHGVLATEPETKRALKYVQSEQNPVTKAMQKAFD